MNTSGRLHLAVLLLVLIVLPAGVLAQSSEPSPLVTRTLTGVLTIIWSDPIPPATGSSNVRYVLVTADGNWHELKLGPDASVTDREMLGWDGERMTVSIARDGSLLAVSDLIPAPRTKSQTRERDPYTGYYPWVSIACRFADEPGEPHSLEYFRGMYASTKPGLVHYWWENSYGNMNLEGSEAYGWFALPHPAAYYVNERGDARLDELLKDCTAAADAQVYFPAFYGINMMFNKNLDDHAYGSRFDTTLDGVTKQYGFTWLPNAYPHISIVYHEMGHAIGWPHSYTADGEPYQSVWDVMSQDRYRCIPEGEFLDPVYGCIGQNTIASNLHSKGWIADEQAYVASWPGQHTLTLERTSRPQTDSFLVAFIRDGRQPFDDVFSVEARYRAGYDKKLPGDAVVIHRTEPWGGVTLVDVDDVVHTDDDGAMWQVGETFTDPDTGLQVSVDAKTPSGFVVTIDVPDWGEPNDTPEQAIKLKDVFWFDSPATVRGLIDGPGDVDFYKVESQSFGWAKLRAEVKADPLGSPLDAVLILYRLANGALVEEKQADDYAGSPDPRLTDYLLPSTTYYLAVQAYGHPTAGGPDHRYQLSVLHEYDRYELNDDFSDATWIQYGSVTEGASISLPGDQDYYRFDGWAGNEVTVDVDAQSMGSRMDPVLYLYDESGALLIEVDDEDYNLDPYLTYTLPEDGSYYLLVRDFDHGEAGGNGHDYQLKLKIHETSEPNDTLEQARSIQYGEIVTDGLIETDGDKDYYAFEGQAGDRVRAQVTADDLNTPLDAELLLLRVVDGQVDHLAWGLGSAPDSEDPRLVYRLPADGTYYLLVESYAFDPSEAEQNYYQLGLYLDNDPYELNDSFLSPPRIAYGDLLDEVTIGARGDVDYYQFAGSAGDEVIVDIDANSIGSPLDSVVSLYDDTWLLLAENDDGDYMDMDSYLTHTLPVDGPYIIKVQEYNHPYKGGSSYQYHLSLSVGDKREPNDEPAEAWPIVYGETASFGSIGAVGDRDYFSFSGKQGESIRVQVLAADSGSPLDSQLTLYHDVGDNLVELAHADDYSFVSVDPRLVFELPADDTYYLLVESSMNDGGARYFYQLMLYEELDGNELNDHFGYATEIGVGDTIDDVTIGLPGDQDYYQFTGEAGDMIQVIVEAEELSPDLDAVLTLLDENDDELLRIDEAETRDAYFAYKLPSDGMYYLRVTDKQHGVRGGPAFRYRLELSSRWTIMMPAVLHGMTP